MTKTIETQVHTDKIRGAYVDLRPYVSSDYIGFEMLREESGLTALQFDAAIISMIHDDDVVIIGESNQKTLTQARRSAAVHFGGQDHHFLKIG